MGDSAIPLCFQLPAFRSNQPQLSPKNLVCPNSYKTLPYKASKGIVKGKREVSYSIIKLNI